jgi:hypothetical protein
VKHHAELNKNQVLSQIAVNENSKLQAQQDRLEQERRTISRINMENEAKQREAKR